MLIPVRSGPADASMTVFVWTFPVSADFANSQAPHIWAYSSSSPDSADPSAGIQMHDRQGRFTLDLTKALAEDSPTPVVSSNADSTASTAIRDTSDKTVRRECCTQLSMQMSGMLIVFHV